LRFCRFRGKRKDSLVHARRHDHIDHQHHRERCRVGGNRRSERDERAGRARDGGDERVDHYVHHLGVAAHELAGLANQRAAKPAGVKRHGLVGQRVEA